MPTSTRPLDDCPVSVQEFGKVRCSLDEVGRINSTHNKHNTTSNLLIITMQITVPDNYGYVILTCAVLPVITSFNMGGPVMKARKEFDVPYPNLYGTPGYHKKADEFNRVQRGHQNMFETLGTFQIAALIGGLKHPLTCAASGVFYCAGCFLFLKGYADQSLDVKVARHMKGGPIKYIGYFSALGSCISLSLSMLGYL